MRALYRMAWASTIATFILIFTGGLVRVSGAGLGCPDWPKCFGRWIPPTSVDQLPAHIDPSLFNFTLAWIEYGNRMLGVLVGLLILITAVLALVNASRHKDIWIPAVASLLLVAYVGWQGGQVVASGLEPLLVAVHLLLSFVIALTLLYLALRVRWRVHPSAETAPRYPAKLAPWLRVTFVLALIQTALGTQLRGAIKVIQELEPLGGHSEWTAAIGPIGHIHQMLGVIVVGLVGHNAATLLKRAENPSPLARQGAIALMAVAAGQLILGPVMLIAGYYPILQVFHLWLTALLLGSLVLLREILARNLRVRPASNN